MRLNFKFSEWIRTLQVSNFWGCSSPDWKQSALASLDCGSVRRYHRCLKSKHLVSLHWRGIRNVTIFKFPITSQPYCPWFTASSKVLTLLYSSFSCTEEELDTCSRYEAARLWCPWWAVDAELLLAWIIGDSFASNRPHTLWKKLSLNCRAKMFQKHWWLLLWPAIRTLPNTSAWILTSNARH